MCSKNAGLPPIRFVQNPLVFHHGVDELVVVLVDGVAVDGVDDLVVGGGYAVLALFTCRFSKGWYEVVDVDGVDLVGLYDFVDLVLVGLLSGGLCNFNLLSKYFLLGVLFSAQFQFP